MGLKNMSKDREITRLIKRGKVDLAIKEYGFEETVELFGPNKFMAEYEYNDIIKHYGVEKFVNLCEKSKYLEHYLRPPGKKLLRSANIIILYSKAISINNYKSLLSDKNIDYITDCYIYSDSEHTLVGMKLINYRTISLNWLAQFDYPCKDEKQGKGKVYKISQDNFKYIIDKLIDTRIVKRINTECKSVEDDRIDVILHKMDEMKKDLSGIKKSNRKESEDICIKYISQNTDKANKKMKKLCDYKNLNETEKVKFRLLLQTISMIANRNFCHVDYMLNNINNNVCNMAAALDNRGESINHAINTLGNGMNAILYQLKANNNVCNEISKTLSSIMCNSEKSIPSNVPSVEYFEQSDMAIQNLIESIDTISTSDEKLLPNISIFDSNYTNTFESLIVEEISEGMSSKEEIQVSSSGPKETPRSNKYVTGVTENERTTGKHVTNSNTEVMIVDKAEQISFSDKFNKQKLSSDRDVTSITEQEAILNKQITNSDKQISCNDKINKEATDITKQKSSSITKHEAILNKKITNSNKPKSSSNKFVTSITQHEEILNTEIISSDKPKSSTDKYVTSITQHEEILNEEVISSDKHKFSITKQEKILNQKVTNSDQRKSSTQQEAISNEEVTSSDKRNSSTDKHVTSITKQEVFFNPEVIIIRDDTTSSDKEEACIHKKMTTSENNELAQPANDKESTSDQQVTNDNKKMKSFTQSGPTLSAIDENQQIAMEREQLSTQTTTTTTSYEASDEYANQRIKQITYELSQEEMERILRTECEPVYLSDDKKQIKVNTPRAIFVLIMNNYQGEVKMSSECIDQYKCLVREERQEIFEYLYSTAWSDIIRRFYDYSKQDPPELYKHPRLRDPPLSTQLTTDDFFEFTEFKMGLIDYKNRFSNRPEFYQIADKIEINSYKLSAEAVRYQIWHRIYPQHHMFKDEKWKKHFKYYESLFKISDVKMPSGKKCSLKCGYEHVEDYKEVGYFRYVSLLGIKF